MSSNAPTGSQPSGSGKKPGADDLINFAKTNTKDTIAYVLLVTGIILSLFGNYIGGCLIGIIVGLYYYQEIANLALNYKKWIGEEGLVKSLILGGAILAFFIANPWIFIFAALTAAILYGIQGGGKQNPESKKE